MPLLVAQLAIVSTPIVLAFCCCFPDHCMSGGSVYGRGGGSQKFSTQVMFTNETCADILPNSPRNLVCATERWKMALYWISVSLTLVTASVLTASQCHWLRSPAWKSGSPNRNRTEQQNVLYEMEEHMPRDNLRKKRAKKMPKKKKVRRKMPSKSKSSRSTRMHMRLHDSSSNQSKSDFDDRHDRESTSDQAAISSGSGSSGSDIDQKEQRQLVLELLRSARSNQSAFQQSISSSSSSGESDDGPPRAPSAAPRPPIPAQAAASEGVAQFLSPRVTLNEGRY